MRELEPRGWGTRGWRCGQLRLGPNYPAVKAQVACEIPVNSETPADASKFEFSIQASKPRDVRDCGGPQAISSKHPMKSLALKEAAGLAPAPEKCCQAGKTQKQDPRAHSHTPKLTGAETKARRGKSLINTTQPARGHTDA